jgi:magnesium transporter
MLREIIDQSESVILINLDSQRNVMLRLSLQLEMGTFSTAIAGLIGVAFGMNLDSSLEDVRQYFSLWRGLVYSCSSLKQPDICHLLIKIDECLTMG